VTIAASVLINQAKTIAQDTSATRWLDAEWLDWLNAGQREIVTVSPDAGRTVANLTTVAGTKQSLPAGATFLHRLIRNMGAGGASPGEAPRPVPMDLMDRQFPTWHADTTGAAVKNYMYDPAVPLVYYVWPPMTGATQVEAEYTALPSDLVSSANNIGVPDRFANALLDYMLYRAFSKEIELPGMADRAALHRGYFEKALGLNTTAVASTEADA
jgi:hypothetical protein